MPATACLPCIIPPCLLQPACYSLSTVHHSTMPATACMLQPACRASFHHACVACSTFCGPETHEPRPQARSGLNPRRVQAYLYEAAASGSMDIPPLPLHLHYVWIMHTRIQPSPAPPEHPQRASHNPTPRNFLTLPKRARAQDRGSESGSRFHSGCGPSAGPTQTRTQRGQASRL